MNIVTFKKHVYCDKLTTTVTGQSLEIRKRKQGKRDVYSYKLGFKSWGRFFTRAQLNNRLKDYKVRVENKKA